MSNRTRTIKSLPLIAVLFTCVVILSSAAIFASEDGSPSSEVTSWLAPDLDSVQAKQLAEEVYPKLSEGTRAAADVNDVYNLLRYDILPGLKGEVSNSNYSLPKLTYYVRQMCFSLFGGTDFTDSSTNNISRFLKAWYDDYVLGMGPNGYGFFQQASDSFEVIYDDIPLIYSSLQQIHSDGQNNTYYLNSLNSSVSSIYSSLSDLHDINWTSSSISPVWVLDHNNQVKSSSFSDSTISVVFNNFSSYFDDIPALFKIYVPIMDSRTNVTVSNISSVLAGYFDSSDNSISYVSNQLEYFVEPCTRGVNIYLFGFRPQNVSYIAFTFNGTLQYDSSYTSSVEFLPFDTYDYQLIKSAFYQAKSASAQVSMSSDVKRLADYLADPDKIAAEQASQGVIDDTLDGFTGSGSAAAKGSDIGSMKNISGSVQSGLDTGASASNAASVFSNQSFWSWFTQNTSNGINNPYPAPVVQNVRGSGDYVPDFLSGNQAELNELLNQRNSW